MKVNLFFNHYENKERQHEIDTCLKNNEEVFDSVYVIGGRPTFEYIFDKMRAFPNDINVFCNSDIYFKEIEQLKKIRENECFALTRWNIVDGKEVNFGRVDSQDAWVFKGAPKLIKAPFTAGLWGCDNRLLHEIQRAGYLVRNPSLSIVTVHLHEVDNRNPQRTEKNTVPPPYKTIAPCLI